MMTSTDSFLIASNVTVCCFGANHIGVPVSAVIAYNCPHIHVSVTDFNSKRILSWMDKQVPIREPNLEEMLAKCLNENLMFTTDMQSAIVLADIVLVTVDVPVMESNNETGINLSELETAARIIAKMSESSKIIVQKCPAPFKAFEFLETILNANKSKNVNFQVLTMPEFFPVGSAVSYLSDPELVLVGRGVFPEDDEAAATLATIYSHWVPWERIKVMSNLTVELVRIGLNALLDQRLTSLSTFASFCDSSGKEFSEIVRILNFNKETSPKSGYTLGEVRPKRNVLNLVHVCQKLKNKTLGSYWEEVLKQNDFQEIRFQKKIFSAFQNALSDKRLAVFGLACDGNDEEKSPGVKLTVRLLQEGAMISLYNPNTNANPEQVLEGMNEAGSNRPTFFDDPYKAADKVHGIIFWADLTAFKSLDFVALHRNMLQPACIFDRRNQLDHEQLVKIGFSVKTFGRDY